MSIAMYRQRLFATRRSRTIAFGVTVAGGAVAGALLTRAEPTGLTTSDALWSAALVAVAGFFGATARRWTWFLPAGAAAMLGGDGVALACAGAAIAIAFASVVLDTRSRARGALVTVLGVLALLRADSVGFHGATALVTAGAIAPLVFSGYTHAGRRARAQTRKVAAVAGAVIGLMLAGAALGIVSVQRDLAEGMRAVDSGMDAARDADDTLAAERLDVAARSLKSADDTLSSWFASPARSLPIVGPNIDSVGSLAAQASDVAAVSALAATTADVDALRFFDGRLDPQAVAAMQDPLERVHDALEGMNEAVGEERSPWLVPMVSQRLDDLGYRLDEAIPEAENAIQAISIAPKMLGADQPQRYLILFTTPVEARGRAGFPGNYAELVIDDGKMSLPVFGRVAELEAAGQGTERTITQPEEMVARYSRFDIANTWRNLTMSPDFASIALAASELYPQSGGQPIDGVLAVDPAGLAALMRYTGEVEVPGLPEPLGPDNTEDYLLLGQYVMFEEDNEQRLDVLDMVARTTFERLTTVDLPGPRVLSEQLDPVVDGGHIQIATLEPETFLPLQVLDETGWIDPNIDGTDAVMFTTANAGASKIDLFLRRSEHYSVRWDPDTGEVTATLRVSLENTSPTEGWPRYVIGNDVGLPEGTNRSYVSIYSPFSMEAARIGGQAAGLQAEVELGRNVYSTFVDIPPGGTVDIELDLVGTIEGSTYELELPVQPAVQPDEAVVEIEVVGDRPVESDEATVEGPVARWEGVLDRAHTLTVTAPSD